MFERTEADYARFVADKQAALKSQPCFLDAGTDPEIFETISRWIVNQYPVPLQRPHTFANVMMQIQEDIVIHCIDNCEDRVSAAHVCLPSSWDPAAVLGKSFEACHQPVPGMDLSQSRRMVEAIVYHGPFERFQWGVFFEDRLNYHPLTAPRRKFDPRNPFVMVKVERQVLYGFPEHNAVAFVLRQHLLPEATLDKHSLAAAIDGMSAAQRSYKGIADCAEPLIRYLRSG
ncbi:MAG: DUF3445 domain-containing protein [Planctomycetaceae bacterium]